MESDDLKTMLQVFAHDLRATYRCAPTTFVMHPRGYDRYAEKIADGKMAPEFTTWFNAHVRRGEYLE
jgi:hypothetical protein